VKWRPVKFDTAICARGHVASARAGAQMQHWIPVFTGMTARWRSHLLWLSALLTSFEVMSTIWIIRSYGMRVGPITPKVPTTWPSTS
jgi:hypothetical protein